VTGDRLRLARLPRTTDRNPYQRRLYAALADHGVDLVADGSLDDAWLEAHLTDVDVLHLHWRLDRLLRPVDTSAPFGPDGAPAPPKDATSDDFAATVAARLADVRRHGVLVAWTVHEPARLGPDGTPFDHAVSRAVADHSDVILVHDVAAAGLTRDALAPSAAIVVVGMGHYAAELPPDPDPASARRRLDLPEDGAVLTVFGHHRADKDLRLLGEALAMSTDDRLTVLLAGDVQDDATSACIAELVAGDRRVHALLRELTDDEVATVLAASDAVVLPRSVEWTPSSLVTALSHGIPVVAADLATTRAHVDAGAWWFTPGDAHSLASAMAEASADPAAARAHGVAGHDAVLTRTWEDVAVRTADALRAAVAARGQAGVTTRDAT